MPTAVHADREETLLHPAYEATPPGPATAEETGPHDLAELWRDLGGSD